MTETPWLTLFYRLKTIPHTNLYMDLFLVAFIAPGWFSQSDSRRITLRTLQNGPLKNLKHIQGDSSKRSRKGVSIHFGRIFSGLQTPSSHLARSNNVAVSGCRRNGLLGSIFLPSAHCPRTRYSLSTRTCSDRHVLMELSASYIIND